MDLSSLPEDVTLSGNISLVVNEKLKLVNSGSDGVSLLGF